MAARGILQNAVQKRRNTANRAGWRILRYTRWRVWNFGVAATQHSFQLATAKVFMSSNLGSDSHWTCSLHWEESLTIAMFCRLTARFPLPISITKKLLNSMEQMAERLLATKEKRACLQRSMSILFLRKFIFSMESSTIWRIKIYWSSGNTSG